MHDYIAAANALENKTILVTGAGDGIGRVAAITYAKHGATVILLGKTTKKLECVYDEIVNAGYPQPAIVPLDMRGATKQNYRDLAATIEQQFGKLDGLLNNASILGSLGPLEHFCVSTFENIMKVNVTAQAMITKYMFPLLRKAPNASIIFTSSGVGRQGREFWGPYAISKFATEGMMQTWASEVGKTNIRINCINPGATRTSMRASAFPGEDKDSLKTPEQLMPTYLYLMSDDSTSVNGQSIDAQPK
ncbi:MULTISPECIES: YciK family oxidoreductase [Pseudoalteromonas]|uniref:YciK family oxidoreductase n=1 Tax=Pseudoalteromonas amylolytica TaxID=1859457 RepID=A0A1S1MPM8_9GAMM|nr:MULTISPECIES: YciK family oxidoreductase [Pseudoalteromonas]MCF6436137.1 YciK family oxidoreductase [Pseudoalteromonas sp. MMG022]OHU86906.1 YciK family oxidoreductase [Pseudoalteromonas sp. JW3]OHU88385.1 YciK family oxidoreductase [Pseudoalteromonas amylolytica]